MSRTDTYRVPRPIRAGGDTATRRKAMLELGAIFDPVSGGFMPRNEVPAEDGEPVATFTDRYGETRTIHKLRGKRLSVQMRRTTAILAANPVMAGLVGERVRRTRLDREWTMEELGAKCGFAGFAKNRIWEIERGVRREGVRLGTLYVLAAALEVELSSLLPTNEEVHAALLESTR